MAPVYQPCTTESGKNRQTRPDSGRYDWISPVWRFAMNPVFAACLLFGLGATSAHAAMVARNIDYDIGGKKMQSVLVYDAATKTPRPGLVMTPDWLGMNENQIALARQIAGKDYVILIADVY